MQMSMPDALEEQEEVPPLEGESVISDTISEEFGPITRMISFHSTRFSRISPTQASAEITAKATSTIKSMKSTVSLQRRNSSGKYVTISGTARSKTVSGSRLTHIITYKISSGNSYRIKSVVNDGTKTSTKYSTL